MQNSTGARKLIFAPPCCVFPAAASHLCIAFLQQHSYNVPVSSIFWSVFSMRTDWAAARRFVLCALLVASCAASNQRSLSLFDPPEFYLPPHPPGAALMSDKFTELPLSAYGDFPSPLTPGSVLMLNTYFQETALPAFVEWPQSQDVFFQSQSFTWEVWVYPFPNQVIGSSILGNLFVGPLHMPPPTHVSAGTTAPLQRQVTASLSQANTRVLMATHTLI